MITIEFDADGFADAMAEVPERMEIRLPQGLEMTCEQIAARARQTTTYTDRTAALRNSTQSAGVTGSASGELVGLVSFAARSSKGALYGVYLELGTRRIRERRFIRDAIDQQDGAALESSMAAAFRDAGFTVRGA